MDDLVNTYDSDLVNACDCEFVDTYKKFFIIYHSDLASLNKRSELISTCRHARKFLIKNG